PEAPRTSPAGRPRDARSGDRCSRAGSFFLQGLCGGDVNHLAVVRDGGLLEDVVRKVERERPVLPESQDEGREVARIEQAPVKGHLRGKVQGGEDSHAVVLNGLAGLRQRAVPAPRGGE